MIEHNDFRKGGVVSVWIGNFSSDAELDEYMNLSRKFEQDFGLDLNDQDTPETVVKELPTPIADLVNGFSWSDSYASQVEVLAERQRIARATTMIIFLNFEYQPKRVKIEEAASLRFLGTARFS